MADHQDPWTRYQADLSSGRLLPDASQANAMIKLQQLYQALPQKLFRQLFFPTPRGLYLWGGVGRGKTYLMDLFFDALPMTQKYRVHFYAFMQEIHEQLSVLQGHKNPLKRLAKSFAKRFQVLCFDEFVVIDIADALILANLLEALFSEGIVLVTTSNTPPDDLYRNGIQRSRFLPAIALLKKFTEVVNIDAGIDYRHHLTAGQAHHQLDTPQTQTWLRQYFLKLSGGVLPSPQDIIIQHRPIHALGVAGSMIWFDFEAICQSARCHYDYLEISSQYTIILFSHVPQLDGKNGGAVRRLIVGSRLAFEFQRTRSRLREMLNGVM